jgi:hypothetical protein
MRRRSSDALAALFFVALSIAMTWPLARHLARAVHDFGDPYLNVFVLDWDVYAMTHRGAHLFDAPDFYPNKTTLAFTEHMLGVAVFAAPLRWLGLGPITTYNILLILGFAFTGFATYLLGRMVSGSIGAGIVAGIFAAFVPWRFVQLTHFQFAWAGWLPLMLAALLHYAKRPTWRNAALFGAAFFLNGWTNLHYFAFGAFAIAIAAVILECGGHAAALRPTAAARPPRSRIVVATVIALILLLPFLLPYRTAMQRYHLRGNVAETQHFSATPADWLHKRHSAEPERWIDPGLIAPLFALAGVLAMRGRIGAAGWIGVAWIAIGFLGSLGLNGPLHTLLFHASGVYRGIRVPARWAVIAYFGIALVACVKRWPPLVYACVAIALLLELRVAPIRWYLAPRELPPVYAWLDTVPPRTPLAHLPIGPDYNEYFYLLGETAHHRPMLNGWGFDPPSTRALLRAGTTDALMDALEANGASLLVVHEERFGPAGADFVQRQVARGRIVPIAHFAEDVLGDTVYVVRKNDPHIPIVGDVPSRAPVGHLDAAIPAEVRGPLVVKGWAFGQAEIARVVFWFEQHTIAIDAPLAPAPEVARHFGAASAAQFRLQLDARPRGVRRETDVEVEVIDRGGASTLLPDSFLTWTKR